LFDAELYKRNGDKKKVEKQKRANKAMAKAVERVAQRGISG